MKFPLAAGIRSIVPVAALAAVTLLSAAILPGQNRAAASEETVTIFAAASTTDAVGEIARLYGARNGVEVRTVFAASSTLAKQIAQGAPADLYLSANQHWMKHLIGKAVIEPGSEVPLLANRLVLVTGSGTRSAPEKAAREVIDSSLPLDAILGDSRLALGDPAHVPAGIYARSALQSLGLWESYKDRMAFSGNVRTALALIERGEAAAGIVYQTDARIVPELHISGVFPPDSHPPIVYPLAMVAGRASERVRAFYDFLLGPEAREIFAAHGFGAVEPDG